MKTMSILGCTIVVVALLVGPVLSRNLSQAAMESTIGGGNCKLCGDNGNTNATCTKGPCTFLNGCEEATGGSYKVCAQGDHPEQQCDNKPDSLTCGQIKSCADGEGSCSSDNYDCSCHSDDKKVNGCA
jgi:hypothetical protein